MKTDLIIHITFLCILDFDDVNILLGGARLFNKRILFLNEYFQYLDSVSTSTDLNMNQVIIRFLFPDQYSVHFNFIPLRFNSTGRNQRLANKSMSSQLQKKHQRDTRDPSRFRDSHCSYEFLFMFICLFCQRSSNTCSFYYFYN